MSTDLQRYIPCASSYCCPEERYTHFVRAAGEPVELGCDGWSLVEVTFLAKKKDAKNQDILVAGKPILEIARKDARLDHLTGDLYNAHGSCHKRGVGCQLGIIGGIPLFVVLAVFFKIIFLIPRLVISFIKGVGEAAKEAETPDAIMVAVHYCFFEVLWKIFITALLCALAPLFLVVMMGLSLYMLCAPTESQVFKAGRTLASLQRIFLAGAKPQNDVLNHKPTSLRDFLENGCAFMGFCLQPLGNIREMKGKEPKYTDITFRKPAPPFAPELVRGGAVVMPLIRGEAVVMPLINDPKKSVVRQMIDDEL